MLIVRSPLRISLAGGGTDLPVFYREYGGMVINIAIDRYFYVFLRTSSQREVHITSANLQTYDYLDHRLVYSWKGGLELPRAIFHHFGISSGVTLFLASEVPPGTGLGSSSTVAVGLIKALSTASGIDMTKVELAELASYIEIEKLGSPIGKQDQYAAAFGGINLIEFKADKTVVTPLSLSPDKIQTLVSHLLLFYTGNKRSANEILSQQKEASKKKKGTVLEALQRVKEMVPSVKSLLEQGEVAGIGEFLHKNWVEKKRFAKGVSNSFIDQCYELALQEGAWGGKITGAGGGGFLLLCCPLEKQQAVARALETQGLQQLIFSIDSSGARVLMNAGLRLTSRQPWVPPGELHRRI
jgi:D-glycero-alpha-D-manno-heptose-7-phosphate kinase